MNHAQGSLLHWFFAFVGSLSIGLLATGSSVRAQDVGGAKEFKTNLDLPVPSIATDEDDTDEDAPEVIVFYGQQYEGDGFFFTVDRSTSMQDSGELARAKREITRNIQELSNRSQFGIVFFDRGLMKYPTTGQPLNATPGTKQAAMSWIASVRGGGGSCCREGILAALQFANRSSAQRKVVVYVGDGGGHCNGQNPTQYLADTLPIVKQQNYQSAQINTVGVLVSTGTQEERFLQNLARQNNGSYKRIN